MAIPKEPPKTRRKRRKKKRTVWQRIRLATRRTLISGLLIVVPLGITGFVLQFFYRMTAGMIVPVVRQFVEPLPPYLDIAISLLLFVVVLYVIGLVATAYVGRKLIELGEAIIQRIPLVKNIYGASKQVVEAVSLQGGFSSLQSVVLVDFPHPGMKAMGFITGKITTQDGEEYYRVFIPTTPNVTTGFLQFVPPHMLLHSSLSVEEAGKLIVSVGILSPPVLNLTPGGAEPPVMPTDSDDDFEDDDSEEEEGAEQEAAIEREKARE